MIKYTLHIARYLLITIASASGSGVGVLCRYCSMN